MNNIVYIKKVDEYNDILREKHFKIPIFFKRIIYMYKNIFNILTKESKEEINIWTLPIKEKYSDIKILKILNKLGKYKDKKFVVSKDLASNKFFKLLDKYNISYFNGGNTKKYLIIKILEYINSIQNEEMSNIEISILVNEASDFNIDFITRISKLVKSVKIVSKNIYKFKNIEENLYNEYGIALQFSNSYKKSLSKSKIIINLDFNKIDINEYIICNKAIIINCTQDNLNIKSKLFNGITINSCIINFKKELRDKFRKINIYHKYDSLILYESNLINLKDTNKIYRKIEEDKVTVSNLIGNNGIINKVEFKNIFKKLDKKLKTE